MARNIRTGLTSLLLSILMLPACTGGERAPTDLVSIAVSIQPQLWLVERIGGGHVEVFSVLTSGDSPHTYQPTDAQITRVLRSRMLIRIGVGFETGPWLAAIRSVGGPQIIDQRRGVPLRDMEDHIHDEQEHAHDEQEHAHDHEQEHAHDPVEQDAPTAHAEEESGRDPHIWLSPPLLKIQAEHIAEALIEIDPRHAADYRENLAVLLNEFDELDAYLRQMLAPLHGHTFLVFHPAWGYFADTYGLVQQAIEIEGKEPSDRELTAIQNLVRVQNIRVIFVQPQIAGQAARAVAQSTGARLETLDPLAPDLVENLRRVARALVDGAR